VGTKLRVAVVGYGYWGAKHVRLLSAMPDVEVAVVDIGEDRLAQAGQTFANVQLFRSIDEAKATVDAFVIATPPRTHAALAMSAISAGCHVLAEKPLALSTAECRALIDAAETAGVTLMVGHTYEYNAAIWKLKNILDAGALGDIYYIDSARLNLGRYQSDVNVVWDLAPHDVSIINALIGRLPVSVSAWAHRSASNRFEDVAYLWLRYTNPAINAYVHVSWLDPCKVRRVTVVGTDKMAVCNDLSDNERLRIYDTGVEPPRDSEPISMMPVSYRYGDIVAPYIPFDEPLLVQDEHFIECIRKGMRPRTDGECGLAVVQVLEAASLALRTGLEVPVESGHHGLFGRNERLVGNQMVVARARAE
jgi:predicted dehydrogenase